jgi:predicted nucleotidyltransferase component of viral defense system
MLNRSLHDTHLRKILNNLFENKTLTSQLAFKGGTCLYMFYGLDRFSTDLDFNALTENLDVEEITKVLGDYGIEDSNFTDKRLTWFWLLNYAKKTMNIKLEVSKRDYPDTYEIKEMLGVRIKCMTQD